MIRKLIAVVILPGFASGLPVAEAHAQVSTYYEQTFLSAPSNWAFRRTFTKADRLFNAFDFGHSILYETLWT